MSRSRTTFSTAPLRKLHALKAVAIFMLGTVAALTAVETGLAVGDRTPMFGQLPFYFETNRGQAEGGFEFLARGQACQFFVAPTVAVLSLSKSVPQSVQARRTHPAVADQSELVRIRQVRLNFLGANPRAQVTGVGELPGKVNYLVGNDPAQWHNGVSLFTRVRVTGIYPGVDLVYYGNQQRLEYDFVVSPHADPGAIKIHFAGPDQVRVDSRGDLLLSLGAETICQPKPILYQIVSGARREIGGAYRLEGRTVTFQIGDYDRTLPLVIDPVLSYSTYFGGNGEDIAHAVAVAGDGSVYVAGETQSAHLSTTPGAFQTNYAGGTTYNGDAFVARFDNTLTNLIFLTYLGGKTADAALALALDGAGNAHLTGYTDSADFPLVSAIYTNIAGVPSGSTGRKPIDAFVATLDAAGSNLLFSTYLGGNGFDEGIGIALDASMNIFVAGYTESTNFPTLNAWQTNYGGSGDAFVARINANGTLAYSTFLGGFKQDAANDVAADTVGHAYVTGYTGSTNFPVTPANAAQTNLNTLTNASLAFDAFVTKISPTGDGLVHSTFLGGTNSDYGYRLALDAERNVYVTGSTLSRNFPRTSTNIPSGVFAGYLTDDVFVTKLSASGSAWVYSAVFGGTGADEGWDVAVDAMGNAHVVGATASVNFPTRNTSGLLRAVNSGGTDAFVAEVSHDGTELFYSAYLGGAGKDLAYGVAVDALGNTYVVGETASGNFPTVLPAQAGFAGVRDAFIAVIAVDSLLTVSLSGSNVVLAWNALAQGFVLQSNTSVTDPAGWNIVPQTPVLVNGWLTVTLGATNDARFFRLRQQ